MTEVENMLDQETSNASKKQSFDPILEEVVAANEDEIQQYQKQLRQFYLHGKKTVDISSKILTPVSTTPWLHDQSLIDLFPAIYENDNHKILGLDQHVHDVYLHHFETEASEESEILRQNLPLITTVIREQLQVEHPVFDYVLHIQEAIKALRRIEVD
ncbi:MAG: hypothetical protein KJP00_06765, partial [Bacteroidia bacterium]|nr:hypothetical protein [Bacteroidia bacterium]